MLRHFLCIILCLASVPAAASERTLLVLGDSLSAGYGINVERGWVSLLSERLHSQGYNYRVINSSISGDTTRGARARLDAALARTRPDVAIVELGGNDGLRGLSLEEMRQNLAAVIERLGEAGARVLLIPMRLPPNYGPAYNERFHSVYQELAEREHVTLGRFILADIADRPALMQADGIHPKEAAQSLMLDNVWPQLRPLLAAGEGS